MATCEAQVVSYVRTGIGSDLSMPYRHPIRSTALIVIQNANCFTNGWQVTVERLALKLRKSFGLTPMSDRVTSVRHGRAMRAKT